MTTIHQIGELLRSGVRPTEEETEDLKSLGGFVAEMYGRFMGGHAEHLTSAADLWSGKISGRLSAATGARWEKGIGLAEQLLGSELTSFWQIAREGFSAGYDSIDTLEMGMVDLYEEDAPDIEAEEVADAPARRRSSLFGAKGRAPAAVRNALRQATRQADRRGEGRTNLETVGLSSETERRVRFDAAGNPVVGSAGKAARDTRWLDGSRAEMAVIRALAEGGLFVGDQVFAAATARETVVRSPVTTVASRPLGTNPVFLDGVRIDQRTPALAAALARVDTVFGRGARVAEGTAAAISQSRLGRLTASADYSIDRGLGMGERPVYGFYDAAETTYLNLQGEASPATEAESAASPQLAHGRARAGRLMPSSAQGKRRSEAMREVGRQSLAAETPRSLTEQDTVALTAAQRTAGSARVARYAPPAVHAVSLDQVVETRGGLRPFVGGVFANPGVTTRSARDGSATPSIALATQFSHTPDGQSAVRVQRGGVSAPRYSVVEATQVSQQGRAVRGDSGLVAGGYSGHTLSALNMAARGGAVPGPGGDLGQASPFWANIAMAEAARVSVASPSAGLFGDGMAVQMGTPRATAGGLTANTSEPGGLAGQVLQKQAGVGIALNPAGGVIVRPGSAVERFTEGAPGVTTLNRNIGGGFEFGRANTTAGTRENWRLAIDGGSDMPLGATFSRHEVFAGGRASQAAGDMRAMRDDFRPVGAGGGEFARPSELAQALDGMVWVTLPSDATEAPTAIEEMGLSAVPSRRAAMVPAGLAFQSIAGVVAGAQRASQAGPSAFYAGPGAVAGRADGSASLRGLMNVRGVEGGLDAGAHDATQALRTSSPYAGPGVTARTDAGSLVRGPTSVREREGGLDAFGGTAAVAGVGQRATSGVQDAGRELVGVPASLLRVGSEPVRRLSGLQGFDGIGFVQALRSGFLGDVSASTTRLGDMATAGIGSVETPTLAAVAARGEGGTGSLSGRWIEAALRGNGLERGLRAARFMDGVVGEGNYGRIESERQLLSMVREPDATVVDESGDGRGVVRGARRASAVGGRAAVRSMFGRTEMKAPARGVETIRSFEQRMGANERAVQTPSGRAELSRTSERAEFSQTEQGSTSFGAMSATLAPDRRMSEARVALSRGVVTARESRAVASLFQSLAQVSGQTITAAMASGQTRRDAIGQLTPMVGADEPVLGRLVQRMNATRAEQPTAVSNWEVPDGIVERLGSLAGPERRNVQRALMLAGWSEPELKMLDIARSDDATRPEGDAADTIMGRNVAQSARASRMGRSIARVVTGAEALGASVADKQVGTAASAIAQGQAASWLPLLASGADTKYFGGLAPGVAGDRAGHVASVREALGSLVKLAQAAVATSDSPLALTARREVLRRAMELKTQAVGIGDRGTLARIMDIAAQAEQLRVLAPESSLSLADELGGRTAAMVGGEQIKGFEDGISARSSAVDGRVIGTGYVDVAQRLMRFNEAERTMVELAADVSDTPAEGLEARIAKALALSAGGPAGARRMLRGGVASQAEMTKAAAPASAAQQRRSMWGGREPDEATLVHDTVMSGRSSLRQQRTGGAARHEAAIREETRRGLSVLLGSIMAPEAMLGGLRSPELSEAIRAVVVRRMQLGEDLVPVLATLADSGVDLSAARSSIAMQVQAEIARRVGVSGATIGGVGQKIDGMAGEKLDFKSIGLGSDQFRSAKSSLAGEAPEREWIEMLSESGDIVSQLSASSGVSRRQRAGVLSAILRGTERAEMTALLEQAGGREFAMAWLNRVDGSRSGIDIGMKGTRQEFGQTFGVRRNSSIAGESPIRDVNYVNTGMDTGEDRSGLRSVAAEMVHTSTGASRPQHGASQAMRRTDWSFVETGSRASTSHADLGKLASAIMGSAESSSRAPMPLVAPAMKAVAQTALRDPTTKSAASDNSSSGGGAAASSGSRGPVDAKMSEKAIEMLAIEMASRVARLMGLTNERRGIWS